MSPLSFHLSLYSDFNIKTMSMVEYLCKKLNYKLILGKYEGYLLKTQQIEYPPIDKNRYHLFYKAIIPVNLSENLLTFQASSDRESVIFKFNGTDQVLLRHLRLKVIELQGKDYYSAEDFMSGVVEYPHENTYLLTEISRVTLEADHRYAVKKLIIFNGQAYHRRQNSIYCKRRID